MPRWEGPAIEGVREVRELTAESTMGGAGGIRARSRVIRNGFRVGGIYPSATERQTW